MESEGSFLCPQEPATGPFPEQEASSYLTKYKKDLIMVTQCYTQCE
jgi:hypothetical protein